MVTALIAGVGFGSYWDAVADDSRGISQLSNGVAAENSQTSSADLLLGQ